MYDQSELNIICPIQEENLAALRSSLEQLEENLTTNRVLPFDKLNTVHFARWVILEPTEDLRGEKIGPQLLLIVDFDGDRKSFLEVFVGACAIDLYALYRYCENFPSQALHDHSAFVSYLETHHVKTSAGFSGHPRKSLVRIHREDMLRESLAECLDRGMEAGVWEGKSKQDVYQDLQKIIKQNPKYHWVFQSKDKNYPWWRKYFPESLLFILIIVLVSLESVFLFLFAVLAFAFSWYLHEKNCQVPSPFDGTHKRVSDLQTQEDHLSQNQMTSITYVKPGLFYLVSLKIILWLVNLLARYKFVDGYLQGISGIHFARWILIDQGRRLLFVSNFDGSWQHYLGDFIDRAALGLTAIWLHTAGFPKLDSKSLGGAWNEVDFKVYARASQTPTQFWYSAYKHLSVENIHQNSSIRQGIVGELTEENSAWIRFL